VLQDRTAKIDTVDKRTVRFDFNEPFLDFPRLIGTANVCGAGWIVPANYYEKVGQEGFVKQPIGAGPYRLVSQEAGTKLEFEAFDGWPRWSRAIGGSNSPASRTRKTRSTICACARRSVSRSTAMR
jgi:peptide/nickel transport system substrate-binding protein